MKDHPVAAHEKIAADLAFDLGLPVPPALLWKREGPRSHGRELVVSAVPFERALTWKQVEASSALSARVLPRLTNFASSISPFDTWILNGDRENNGNLILSEDLSSAPPILRVAYIDFANALSRAFRIKPDIWKDETYISVPYPTGVPVDLVAMASMVSRIEALPADGIRKVVQRIPMDLLDPADRDEIIEVLLYRQPRLRGIMKSYYAGLS